MKRTVAYLISQAIESIANAVHGKNKVWEEKHLDRLQSLVEDYLPHGAGFDAGCKIQLDKCVDGRLVFRADYHHMDQHGCYDGWTEHIVTVEPHFCYGMTIKVSGRNRNDIKDYIRDTVQECLSREIEQRRVPESDPAVAAANNLSPAALVEAAKNSEALHD